MPFVSKQQAKFFYAASKKKKGLDGLSQDVAQKFIDDTEHQKLKTLPNYKGKSRFKHIKGLMKVK